MAREFAKGGCNGRGGEEKQEGGSLIVLGIGYRKRCHHRVQRTPTGTILVLSKEVLLWKGKYLLSVLRRAGKISSDES